jgi:predicted nucleic acid-binding protein
VLLAILASPSAASAALEALGVTHDAVVENMRQWVSDPDAPGDREFCLRLPDALIAATALERGLQLSTRNTKDFENVRGLRFRSLR